MSDGRGDWVSIGRGGWTVHIGRLRTISHYGDTGWEKYCDPGCPVIDTRTIPDDKIIKWGLWSPQPDCELEESESTKVEMNDAGLSTGKYADFFNVAIRKHGHPTMKLMSYGNLAKCTLDDYMKLAAEWGATVYRVG